MGNLSFSIIPTITHTQIILKQIPASYIHISVRITKDSTISTISLSHNQISQFPDCLKKMVMLCFLNQNHNRSVLVPLG